jgi:hypothetical protein
MRNGSSGGSHAKRPQKLPAGSIRAKSWLYHHTRFHRCAPRLILNPLKGAWNSRFAEAGAEFDRQEITITGPDSFDAAPQRLTLMAAQQIGFPETIRLPEEPLATFYCWLDRHDLATKLGSKLADSKDGRHDTLVVDMLNRG